MVITMTAPQAYAPTTTALQDVTGTRNGINLDQEVTRNSIARTPILKTVYDSLCEIYSIVTVLELVEKSFVKDYLTDEEKYTATVMRLINQYSILLLTVSGSGANEAALRQILPELNADRSNFLSVFQRKFRLTASLAAERLTTGIPATIEQLAAVQGAGLQTEQSSKSSRASARLVAEATGSFITTMDALKLEYSSKLQLHPLLSGLVLSLNELSTINSETSQNVPVEFEGKSKLVTWLIKLNNLGDTQQLTAEEREDFLSDLDFAYRGFYNSLE